MNALDHFFQLPESLEASPGLLRTLSELEHHVEQAVTGQTAFRPLGPMPNGAKRRFNRIRRAKTLPMMSRKLVER